MTGAEAVAGAGVVVALVTYVLLAVVAVATRPRPPDEGAATMELGDEPPAVVDLLTDDFEVTADAVPATLVDLAARRWLHIEQYGEGNVVIRVRASDPPGEGSLRPYEQQVLDHVRGLAVDGIVPAPAMTTGPAAASRGWWKRFRKAVVSQAQEEGLCRPRWRKSSVAFVGIGAVLAFGAAWLGSSLAGESEDFRFVDALIIGSIAGGVSLSSIAAALGASDRQRDTPLGLEVAGRWLGTRRYMTEHGNFEALDAAAVTVWDRYLSHAVALGLAPIVVAQLPLGAEDDRHAWSRATGQWRQVVVRYPRSVLGRGRHPLGVAFVSLLTGAAGVGLLMLVDGLPPSSESEVRWAVGGATAIAVVVLVVAFVAIVRAIADVVSTETVEGVLLRARTRPASAAEPVRYRGRRRSRNRPPRYYVAVDDGTSSEIRAWRVRPQIYAAVSQGNRVRAVVTPRLGYVRSIETIAIGQGGG